MRVRFAPSPTGFLHIGNARTAISNYIFAKKNNGKLVLRIEDTDAERSSKESEESIMSDLKWLGIEWDEGPEKGGDNGPYRQSERFDIYKEYADKLLNEKKAYKCFCTKEEIDSQRKEAEKNKTGYIYSEKCRNLSDEEISKLENEGKDFTIRFKIPENKIVTVKDSIKGNVEFNSANIGGDFIIARTDGSPIYNFIVSIDDSLMQITDVIRGDDHFSNTPKQILISEALGINLPLYTHLPLIVGSDRAKLSKRHGITSVDLYRKEGYLPEALFNYLAMLGWATESGEEILSQEEIIKLININKLAKSSATFDYKKLKWMNGIYIKNYPVEKIIELFLPHINDAGYKTDEIDEGLLKNIIEILKGYCEILSDIGGLMGIFLDKTPVHDDDTKKMLREDYSIEVIKAAKELFESKLNEDNFISELIGEIKEKTGNKGKKLFMPIRAMMTGRLKGPELDIALPIIGFENCKNRIEYCYKTYTSPPAPLPGGEGS